MSPQVQIPIATSLDDEAVYRQGATYPPTTATSVETTADNVSASRYLSGGQYIIRCGFFRFDTSILPDEAVVTGATLRVFVLAGTITNADARNLTADWYPWTPNVTVSDHTATAGTNAIPGVSLSALAAGASNDIVLADPSNHVNPYGYTGLRVHVSGGQPTGLNVVSFASFDHASAAEALLIVDYDLPAPTTRKPAVGAVLSGKYGSIQMQASLYLSNASGEEISPLKCGRSMSVSMSNDRDWAWELAFSMEASDSLDPATDRVLAVVDLKLGDEWDRFYAGLYSMFFPNDEHLYKKKFWNLTGRSAEWILAEDMVPNLHQVAAGTGVLAAAKNVLIGEFAVPAAMIDFPPATEDVLLLQPMVFAVPKDEQGAIWLNVVNALLAAGGFEPLYTTGRGIFRTKRVRPLGENVPDAAYGQGGDNIIDGSNPIPVTRDSSEFANRVLVLSNDVLLPPIAAVAVNDNPNSKSSILPPPAGLGRAVTKTVSLQQLVSQSVAQSLADAEIARRSGLNEELTFSTILDPRRGPREVLDFVATNAEGEKIAGGLWAWKGWTADLHTAEGSVGTMEHTLTRVETI